MVSRQPPRHWKRVAITSQATLHRQRRRKTGRIEIGRMVDAIVSDLARLGIHEWITKPLFLAAKGFFSGEPTTPADFKHAGGPAGSGPPVVVPLFAGAPRLRGGGGFIGPGEIPAILKRGEVVFTPEQLAALGQREVGRDVRIVDERKQQGPIEVREAQGIGGRKMLKITVRDALNDLLSTGELNGPLGQAYGLRPAPVGR